MEKFELLFNVKKGEYLIPEVLSIQQPKLPEQEGPVLRFFFRYEDLLPRSIITRFIVRMHEDIKSKLRWRTGVVLEDDTYQSLAIVIADYKEKRVDVSVSGKYRRQYFALIRKHFRTLHNVFEKLDVGEWIPLPGTDGHAVSYANLIGHEDKRKAEYFDGELSKDFNVQELLNGIELESMRKPGFTWDVFLCHSSKDKDTVRQIGKEINKLGKTYLAG